MLTDSRVKADWSFHTVDNGEDSLAQPFAAPMNLLKRLAMWKDLEEYECFRSSHIICLSIMLLASTQDYSLYRYMSNTKLKTQLEV